MAVLVRRQTHVGGKTVEVKVYQPSGSISREDRKRADHLDEVLKDRIPSIARELAIMPGDIGLIRHRYELGLRLRAIVDDRRLVRSADIADGHVWEAIWYYLPDSLRPSGTAGDEKYTDKEARRMGFFSLCYAISAFSWTEIAWINRWTDWYEIASRPSLLNDLRILHTMAEEIGRLDEYPAKEQFQEIVKALAAEFPTRHLRDTTLLKDEEVARRVVSAIRRACNVDQ